MTVMLIKIVLLIVGAAATIAAYGGDTWETYESGKFKRVNARGWTTLACLALALAGGAFLEIYDYRSQVAAAALAAENATRAADEAAKAAAKSAEEKKQLEAQVKILNDMLKTVPKDIEQSAFDRVYNDKGYVKGTNAKRLVVYPGELIDYQTIYPLGSKIRNGFILKVGDYSFEGKDSGTIFVIGESNKKLNVRITGEDATQDSFHMKLHVRSSIRHIYDPSSIPAPDAPIPKK